MPYKYILIVRCTCWMYCNCNFPILIALRKYLKQNRRQQTTTKISYTTYHKHDKPNHKQTNKNGIKYSHEHILTNKNEKRYLKKNHIQFPITSFLIYSTGLCANDKRKSISLCNNAHTRKNKNKHPFWPFHLTEKLTKKHVSRNKYIKPWNILPK